MAKLSLYVIFDKKVGAYNKPFPEVNDVMAVRSLHAVLLDDKIQLSMFPECFDLFRIGEFDDQSGEITPEKPCFIVSAVSLKNDIEKRRKGVEDATN